jgi:curved DNA-binding protein CbpA
LGSLRWDLFLKNGWWTGLLCDIECFENGNNAKEYNWVSFGFFVVVGLLIDFLWILKASFEEIRSAYKKLAIIYHPDVHQGASNGDTDIIREAQEKFTEIKLAYETLSDEKKRTLYDIYGAQGVQSGWELAQKYSSTEEVSLDYTFSSIISLLSLHPLDLSYLSRCFANLKRLKRKKKALQELERCREEVVYSILVCPFNQYAGGLRIGFSLIDIYDWYEEKYRLPSVTSMQITQNLTVTT